MRRRLWSARSSDHRVAWMPMLANGSGGNGSGLRRTISSRVRSVGRPSSRSRPHRRRTGPAPTPRPVKLLTAIRLRPASPQCAQNCVLVSMAPAQRWAEPDVLELREGDEEVRGQPPEHLEAIRTSGRRGGSDPNRVTAAPHDPVVRREPVVVELVGGVADALARAPADPVELLVRQRLGGQHVVVDRDGVQPVAAQQAREHARGQHHPGRADHPGFGTTRPRRDRRGIDVAAVPADLHTVLRTGAGQPEDQLRRVHDPRRYW